MDYIKEKLIWFFFASLSVFDGDGDLDSTSYLVEYCFDV